jgi:cytochrome P450
MKSNQKDVKEANNSPTIFHELINSDITAEEKSVARFVDEGITLIGAGTVTTAHVLSTTSYHILANPEILHKLQKELKEAMPDGSFGPSAQNTLNQLEHLPYLTAIIKEGLRLTHAISHRNARVAQDRALKFQDWTIPPGTIVSMTALMLHIDPSVFPTPQEFRPERWLQESPTTKPLEKYLLPFGRGSRICLGMNLAYAELYMALAAVFRRFELSLFETTRDDVEVVHDFVAGSARLDSKGARVAVEGRRE